MKENSFRARFAIATVGGITLLVLFGAVLLQKSAIAASKAPRPDTADQTAFLSDTAISARDAGSPIGPPKKFIICYKGHSIRVPERAIPSFLARGAYPGPCTNGIGDMVICLHGHTLIVPNGPLPPGATAGPCSNLVFMCNLHLHTISVRPDQIGKHLAKGHHLGICPGRTMICHKGHTIVVSDSSLPAHLAHDDCIGYCLGIQGPLGGISICASNSTAAAVSQ